MNISHPTATSDGILADTLIYNIKEQTVNEQAVHAALEAGKTVAFKHTAAGQPGKIIPGIDIPHGLALFAVKQAPIPGYPGTKHIITTIIPETIPVTTQRISVDKGVQENQPATFSLSEEEIDEEIRKHIQLQPEAYNGLVPPTALSAFFGAVTQNFPFSRDYSQNFWAHHKGSSQTIQAVARQTYYVYLTQNGGQTQFDIIIVQTGYTQASASGTLACNDDQERVFLNSCFHLKQNLQGCSNTFSSSPGTILNGPQPITDKISVPLQLICKKGAQIGINGFTPQYSNSVLSTDFAIMLTQDSGNIDWCYYNTNPWNALQQKFQNYNDWWQRMYDSNDNVVPVNNQCTGVVNFDAVSLWNIHAAKGMRNLYVTFGFSGNYDFVGFVDRRGSGSGHHQMLQVSPFNTPNPAGYDLIALTHSSSYFNG
ncbi:hypothetical protein [Chitinophaga varians]|uniref:hypothetical protein n=1 Tax=Chitinophaga varians TaxID=2202339 RepID=UPI00165F719A|nr:hypothetical protein [Chitinophaga varians]MBC9909456.1 hypothetical protein [Chitinophaga varians]